MNDDLTTLTLESQDGDERAADRLMALLYAQLRAMARKKIAGEKAGRTLQPTDLVHEAYLRLIDNDKVDYRSKTHFLALAARSLGQVLIHAARKRHAQKRGGDPERLSLSGVALDEGANEGRRQIDVLELEEALSLLEARNPVLRQVADLRIFAGFDTEETALALGLAERTVRAYWMTARAIIAQFLSLGNDEKE